MFTVYMMTTGAADDKMVSMTTIAFWATWGTPEVVLVLTSVRPSESTLSKVTLKAGAEEVGKW